MRILTLPAAVTRLLNALHHGTDSQSAYQNYAVERAESAAWLEQASSFSVDDKEALDLEDARSLLNSIDHLLAQPNPESSILELTQLMVEFYALVGSVRAGRKSRALAQDETVNSGLLAVEAHLAGRLDRSALEFWLVTMENYLQNAWEQAITLEIPASEKGFTAFEQGLKGWRIALDTRCPEARDWRQAVSWLAWGNWAIEAFLEPARTTHHQDALESHRSVFRDLILQTAGAEDLENAIDALVESWQTRLDTLLLPWACRLSAEEKMERAIERLEEDLASGSAEAFQSVAELWCQVVQQGHQGHPSLPPTQVALLQAMAGVLREEVPDLILADLLEFCLTEGTVPEEAMQGVREYFKAGDIDQLHLAVDSLLTVRPEQRLAA